MDLAALYAWIVFVHVAAAFTFVIGHGTSAWASDQIRRERDPERIRALLELSGRSLGFVYGALLVLLVSGIVAGLIGGHFSRWWIWLSLAILLGTIVAMYLLASRYYARVRNAVGLPSYLDKKGASPPAPAAPAELDALLRTSRPDVIGLVGFGALLVLIWLMMFQPF